MPDKGPYEGRASVCEEMKDSIPHFSTVGVVVDFRLSAALVLIVALSCMII
jgi:hypothetical protein